MSKADQKRVAEIQSILDMDETSAVTILNFIEDHLDPNWSEITDRDFRSVVATAFDLIGEAL